MCIEQIIQIIHQFNISLEASRAIKEFEGCRLDAYEDAAGVYSIGYGHTRGVDKGDRISQWYADELFALDISECESAVNKLAVCKTQGQFDALVDFVYNLGLGSLLRSTLLRYIREGRDTSEIQEQFMRWCYSGRKRLPGLVRRCEWRASRWAEE